MIFLHVNDALLFELADFGGETASVNDEEICQLLTVEGDVKGILSHLLRLDVEIGEKLFSRRPLGGDLHTLMENDRFQGKVLH